MSVAGDSTPVGRDERAALVRRGLRLNYLTIAYNSLEAIASLVAGLVAGSVALVGFGFDSVIEVTASGAAQWRLRTDWDDERRERIERTTLRVVGWCFIALAGYVTYDSATSLWLREAPERSIVGIVILGLSVVVMPLLARAKRRVARGLRSPALESEAAQVTLRLSLHHRARRRGAQRGIRMVVGRSTRRARNGTNHHEGGRRRYSWRTVLRRSLLLGIVCPLKDASPDSWPSSPLGRIPGVHPAPFVACISAPMPCQRTGENAAGRSA